MKRYLFLFLLLGSVLSTVEATSFAALKSAPVSTSGAAVMAQSEGNVLETGADGLETAVQDFIDTNGKDALKTLVITGGEISLDLYKYIAGTLPDLYMLDMTNATLASDVLLPAGTQVNWEVLVMPKGTVHSPNFKDNCYPNLKVAYSGSYNKIWLVSQKGKNGQTEAYGQDILSLIPQEVKDMPNTARVGVAFVGEVTADDVAGIAGSWDAPLKNARIWHFYHAKGLTIDDFQNGKTLFNALQGDHNDPTGLVLPAGFDVDAVGWHTGKGNVYSLSEDEKTLTVNIAKTATFDLARFTTVNTVKAVLVSGARNDWGRNNMVKLDGNIIEALKRTKQAKTVDISGMDFPVDESGNKQPFGYLLKDVTTGTVEYIRIPSSDDGFDINDYKGTTFGVIARIRKEDNIDVAIVYQRVPNTLYRNMDHRSTDIITNERIRYRGMMNMLDLNNVYKENSNRYYDLSDVEIVQYKNQEDRENFHPETFDEAMVEKVENPDMSHITNPVVEYIAMPHGTTLPDADAIKANCPGLLAMGVMDNTTKTFSGHSWKNTDENGAQISSLRKITDMFTTPGGDEVLRGNIENVVLGGYLNAADIATNWAYGGNEAFQGATIKNLDLSNAVFGNANDMVMLNVGIAQNLQTIKIPLKMTELPENFMEGCSSVKELYIPEGYETVGKNAFNGMNLTHIYTDAKKAEDGTVVIPGDNGENTLTIPASIKKICTGAFSLSNQVVINDVYVLATKAPECQIDAFSSAMYFNNNSYSPDVPISQHSYQNGGTSAMSVLHFPVECDETETNKYTDPTRDYTLGDGLGTTDANGHLIYWPNQSEFNAAFVQAVCGYTWKSWKIERAGYSSEIANLDLQPGGTDGMKVLEARKEDADSYFAANGSPASTVFYDAESADVNKSTDYRGWHQFVLTSYSRGKDADPTFDFGKINDNNWWTICLPFSLTKKDIEEIYGEGTVVCTLVDVIRDYTKNSITLKFGKDIMKETPESVIKAGFPYMIKPNIPEDKAPADFILSSEKYTPEIPDGADGAYAILNKDFDIPAHDEKGNVDAGYTYKFVGSFAKYYIPPYSYFLAWDNKNSRPAYFYQKEMAGKDKRNWNPYTCVITVNWKNPQWILANPTENTVAHWNAITADKAGLEINCKDDSFTVPGTSGNAKTTNMIFGDGGTTGINTVHTSNGTIDFAEGKIYNLNGQLVGEGGNLNVLPAGIYVINGKKYVKQK